MHAVTLLGQLFGLTFPSGISMQSFLMKIKVIHDQLLAMNSALSGTELKTLVLVKLLEDYDVISEALRLQIIKSKLEFERMLALFLLRKKPLHLCSFLLHAQTLPSSPSPNQT